MKYVLTISLLSYAALIGIDLGSEFIKTSVITPGRKLEIVESPQSKRLLPNTIAFAETRLYGENAVAFLSKDPESVVEFNQRLMGQSYNKTARLMNEYSLANYSKTYRDSASYYIKGRIFTVEEISAMQLEFVQSLASKTVSIVDCVISVPAFFSQSQRKNLINTAESAKFNVLALINDNSAAALTYGIERSDTKPIYVIIYNIGSSFIQASLIRYSLVKTNKSKLSDIKNELIDVISHEYNTNIGGRTIDSYIADFIASEFYRQHQLDPRTNPKAKARLIQESNKAKKTLSANKETLVNLPALINNINFELKLTRSIIEDYINNYQAEFTSPVFRLLEKNQLDIGKIQYIELIGGVSRIPSLQKLLNSKFKEVNTHLNGDESIANGAALFGANFSSEVQIKQVWLSEAYRYRVNADIIYSEITARKTKEIFNEKSLIGSVKKIAISSNEDVLVVLSIQYNESYEEIVTYRVEGISEHSEKFQKPANVVLEFKIDYYGIVSLTSAEIRGEIDQKSQEKQANKYKLRLTELYKESPVPISSLEISNIKSTLESFTAFESELQLRIELKNELETFIYEAKEKLESPDFTRVLSPSDFKELNETMNSTEIWLENLKINEISSTLFRQKLERLQGIFSPAEKREKAVMDRDDVVLEAYIKLKDLKNEMSELNVTKDWIDLAVRDGGFKVIQETIQWIDSAVEEQRRAGDWENILKVEEVEMKIKTAEKSIGMIRNMRKGKGGDL